MSDPVSLAPLFDAAEQAALSGDFAAAARLLGEAARAQAAALGPDHLDLANTLNNLAVAHERCGQIDDAEREYRRAHTIAARALPADDPLVTTSAQNLREFCEANGRPIDVPQALSLAEGDPDADTQPALSASVAQADVPTGPIEPLAITFDGAPAPSAPSEVSPSAPPPSAPPQSAPPPTAPRPTATPAAPSAQAPPRPAPPQPAPAAAATLPATPVPARPSAPPRTTPAKPGPAAAPAAARDIARAPAARASAAPASATPARRPSIPVWIAIGAVIVLLIWLFAGRGPGTSPAEPQAAAPDAPPAVAPTPGPPPSAPAATPAPPRASAAPATTAPGADGLSLGDAQLCTSLSAAFACEAAGTTVRPGRLAFYTRLIALQNTSVVHRWYRGNELRQTVRLDVAARRQGFRTFSRATVSASEDEWRVELRTRDGRLLHTERFTVR